ncbi:BREX-1 system phosphatase PglZ type B [Ottowia sp.]|uniref:BREX-1 system phosphatase PglZ type B n=1 Tax=Ottowia sp. TaxID=1898956 RepID=UPI002CD25EBC|nr:BREX-1 system phosphatase PglZ type B [Ottowia sp.]HNR84838.1 BREX-1 system phosphatase PglZ type B [Ottowia sp.]
MDEPNTFLDGLTMALARAGDFNKNDQTPPAAILWPDKERQWEPLLPALRLRLSLLTLGDYNPAAASGPATYLRCMIAGALDDALPAGGVPVIYLPGVSRQELRAVEECPKPLQPLAELQYRGVIFSHKNGRDWTIAAFLQAADGLGVAVGADAATREAMQRSLLKLAEEPLTHLRQQAPLRAPFFDALLHPDDVRRLLKWLDDPQGYPTQLTAEEWHSFCALCRDKYAFDPAADGPLTAAGKLGARYGAWAAVWERYEEVPTAYPNLPDLLRQVQPQQLGLFGEPQPTWPGYNEQQESALRAELLALKDQPAGVARQAVLDLEAQHGPRRAWVWAQLGQAPLANALRPLAALAKLTGQPLGGATLEAVAGAYAGWGWQVDAATLDALALVEWADDVAAVKAAIAPLYRPWLEGAALAFQAAVMPHPEQRYVVAPLPPLEPGACVLFCDALRMDLGQRLAADLAGRGLAAETGWRLAALPPVTSTAKPAVSPVAGQMAGQGRHDLTPVSAASGTAVTVAVLRSLLHESGYQVLQGDALGDPTGRAWTEFGAIDRYGHDHGWKIALHAPDELKALAERIEALLRHGWQRVVVVTDHGWLLLPGGLPKADLPQHLTHKRKGRCALLKEGAVTDQQTVPWHWDPNVRVALASGIRCYEAGHEYEHGGLSPQECVTPLITAALPGGNQPLLAE